MKVEIFNILLAERMRKTVAVLDKKAGEYSGPIDRLHNFKLAAALQGCTPADALLGMATKHLVSIVDLVKSGKAPSQAMIDEKIGDSINYLILLEAVWEDMACAERAKEMQHAEHDRLADAVQEYLDVMRVGMEGDMPTIMRHLAREAIAKQQGDV